MSEKKKNNIHFNAPHKTVLKINRNYSQNQNKSPFNTIFKSNNASKMSNNNHFESLKAPLRWHHAKRWKRSKFSPAAQVRGSRAQPRGGHSAEHLSYSCACDRGASAGGRPVTRYADIILFLQRNKF